MAAIGDDIFVYLGGEQEVPRGVTHAIIDPSVKTVRRGAFAHRQHLVSIIFHDGVEIVEGGSFNGCRSLRGRIKLLGVREIGEGAFYGCVALSGVELGNWLETIENTAFRFCSSLRSIKMPSVRTVQGFAFNNCEQLTDVEFGMNLETIGFNTFKNCPNLRRIAIPFKDNLFPRDPIEHLLSMEHRYTQFDDCDDLTAVNLVGGIYNTISSLLIESWKNEMNEEINRINRELPNRVANEKTDAIRLWIRSVINRMDHYKAEHNRLLKEHMTLLQLAIWKAKLDEKEDDLQTKGAKIDEESTREEKRITSGADIVIRNVVPFLKLG